MEISPEEFRAIEQEIESDASPVGIDAKKTHVMILYRLQRMEERLRRIEERLGEEDWRGGPGP